MVACRINQGMALARSTRSVRVTYPELPSIAQEDLPQVVIDMENDVESSYEEDASEDMNEFVRSAVPTEAVRGLIEVHKSCFAEAKLVEPDVENETNLVANRV